jgi:hypothetical protein
MSESAVRTPVTGFFDPMSKRLHNVAVAKSGSKASVKSAPEIDFTSLTEAEKYAPCQHANTVNTYLHSIKRRSTSSIALVKSVS